MTKSVPRKQRRAAVSVLAFLGFFTLLMAPAAAVARLARTFDWRYVVGYAVGISVVTFWAYRHDKKSAQHGEQRTPEFTLHLGEMLGGWPGAFLAQRIFRHKIIKVPYQVVFWSIVALHEYAAFDFARDWQFAKMLLAFLS